LLTVPLADTLVQRLAEIAPEELEVVSLTPLRTPRDGFPSTREMACVSADALRPLRDARIVLGAWTRPLQRLIAEHGGLATVAPRLEWIQLTSAGADHVDVSALHAHGVTLTTAQGVQARPIAEFVLASIFAWAKDVPSLVRRQQSRRWQRDGVLEVTGRTVGILGFGSIGLEVAALVRAIGMRVVAAVRSTPSPEQRERADEIVPWSDRESLLARSDYLVLALPLSDETRGLIGEGEIARMPAASVLINVGRGDIVDEDALVRALRARTIRGASLDVFATEPLPANSPLWELDGALLSPHVAAGSDRYDARVAELFVENVAAFRAGRPLRNVLR
jgi:phosphoglycerate dehydrogenase-like enzyme